MSCRIPYRYYIQETFICGLASWVEDERAESKGVVVYKRKRWDRYENEGAGSTGEPMTRDLKLGRIIRMVMHCGIVLRDRSLKASAYVNVHPPDLLSPSNVNYSTIYCGTVILPR